MSSKRKQAAAEPPAAASSSIVPQNEQAPKQDPPEQLPKEGKAINDSYASANTSAPAPLESRSSRYGSWRSKSSPVAQIAKESIQVAQGATSELASGTNSRASSSVSKSAKGATRKSLPLAAEATHIYATYGHAKPRSPSLEKQGKAENTTEPKNGLETETGQDQDATAMTTVGVRSDDVTSAEKIGRPQSGSWFGWWSRPDGYATEQERATKKPKLDDEVANTANAITSSDGDNRDAGAQNAMQFEGLASTAGDGQKDAVRSQNGYNVSSTRSWFGLWSAAQNEEAQKQDQLQEDTKSASVPDVAKIIETSQTALAQSQSKIAADSSETKVDRTTGSKSVQGIQEDAKLSSLADRDDRAKSSGWAFWLSSRTKDSSEPTNETQKQVGELAVAGTPSQSHPEAAQFNERPHSPKDQADLSLPIAPLTRRDEPRSKQSAAPVPINQSSVAPPILTPPEETAAVRANDRKPMKSGKSAQTRSNMTLPTFNESLPQLPSPGYVERLSQYLAQSLSWSAAEPDSRPQHVFVSLTPPKVKRAVAIGVHGFFPAPLLQKVLGPPTGTSIRFANYAASSIKAWCRQHQPDIKEVKIEKVALEGEGYISDRVATLWKLLLNWLNDLRRADFILVACHSQGVPVAIMLLAKLVQLGCLDPHVKISVCAMAGINLGPFAEYKSRLFGGSALELFDFCDSRSYVSKSYAEAVETCLRHGVRITYIGSMDDQLVSLESSLHTPLSHPYVFRAVFIDGRLHAPNFLTRLVAFALRLRNIGISDHGLIRELSAPLAGSLVGGEGHSRIYDDLAVYTLAIDFALRTTDAQPRSVVKSSTWEADNEKAREAATNRRASHGGLPASPALANAIRRGSFSAASSSLQGIAPVFSPYEAPPSASTGNPFYLPWAVRGLLEEDVVKREMKEEVDSLVSQFEQWTPTSKALKDVRWRLEGVKNMR